MKLYLVRHGETEWNLSNRIQGQSDIPLNETGRNQARELSKVIAGSELSFDRIYTSRMIRAKETAEILASELGLTYSVLAGIEEMNLGSWEGYTWRQVREVFPQEYAVWHENRRYQVIPQGESYEQLLQRVLPALKGIALQEEGKALLVTHSAVIMTLLSYFHEKPFEDMAKNFKTKNTEIVELKEDIMEALCTR